MVKEKVEYDNNKNGDIQKNIIHFEQLVVDLIGLFSKSISFCNHSGEFINELIKQLTRNNEEINHKNEDEKQEILQNDSFIHENNVNMDNDDDDDVDLIRFSNSGPVYCLPKRITNSLEGSLIHEYSEESQRASDGSIYLDYRNDDTFVPYVMDKLMNKKIDIEVLNMKDQIGLLNLFEYCGLPIPEELMNCRERRNSTMKHYSYGDEVILCINDKRDDILRDYWKKNGIWYDVVNKYCYGYVDYDEKTNIMSIKMNYTYIDYIDYYILNECIFIEDKNNENLNKELLEKEMVELFGDEGKEAVKEVMMKIRTVFMNSTIIEKKCFETPLVNWLGKEKKWKLLYRASEHDYLLSEFHKYCDNKGETIVLVKHIGHNNHVNIFGGYTDQSWDSSIIKPYSKEFLFTLSNEHGIPPTKYDHNGHGRGIWCDPTFGPVFGSTDLVIRDDCHKDNNNSWNTFGSFTTIQTPQKNSLFVNTNKPDVKNKFILEDYEVWGRA
ncbi:hypothetical protein WA158_003186 [Blastocystis sp. Blastoise]